MEGQKRSANEAGLSSDRPAKTFRLEDALSKLDASVRIKLRSMFDDSVISENEVDERNLEKLSEFDASDALEILEGFTQKVSDNDSIRNKAAYLAGAIRNQAHKIRPPVSQEIKDRLEVLYSEGRVREGDLDKRCMDALASLPVNTALAVIQRFSSKDLTEVRNISALFMSTIKAVDADSYNQRGGDRDRGRVGDRHQQYQPPQQQYQPRQRSPPPRDGRHDSYRGGGSSYNQRPPPPEPRAARPPAQPMAIAYAPPPPVRPTYAAAPAGFYAPVAAPAYPPPAAAVVPGGPRPGFIPPPPKPELAGRYKGTEQAALGVRINEFHALSSFAPYVTAAPAIKLQQLWDDGNELVSMLDDRAWEVLADLGPAEAVVAIDEAAKRLDEPGGGQIRNINAYFMSQVKKVGPSKPRDSYADHRDRDGHRDFRDRDRGRDFQRDPRRDDHRDHRDRYDSRNDRGAGGAPPGGMGQQSRFSRNPAIHLLPPEQRELAEALCKKLAPHLRTDHFDEGVIDTLKRMSTSEGVAVLRELEANNLGDVRNMPSYIMGICKRVRTARR